MKISCSINPGSTGRFTFKHPKCEETLPHHSSTTRSKNSNKMLFHFELRFRRVTIEKERVAVQLHLVRGDIRKLLRARGSVDQLQSLLKEKSVPLGGSRSNSITSYSRSSLVHKGEQAVSPRISNLDRSASPTRQELKTMMEHGETPLRCHQHRACRPHYPKAYEKLVDSMSRKAPAPFCQVPASASLSSAPSPSSPAPTSAPFSPGPAPAALSPEPPPASFSVARNSCS